MPVFKFKEKSIVHEKFICNIRFRVHGDRDARDTRGPREPVTPVAGRAPADGQPGGRRDSSDGVVRTKVVWIREIILCVVGMCGIFRGCLGAIGQDFEK